MRQIDGVKGGFRPEFINRIDEVVVFHALDEKSIACIQLNDLEKRVVKMEMIPLHSIRAVLTESIGAIQPLLHEPRFAHCRV